MVPLLSLTSFLFICHSFAMEDITPHERQNHTHEDPHTEAKAGLYCSFFFFWITACGVFCGGLEDCLEQQGNSPADVFCRCQMLKPNCLYPPRYCITCSKRAGTAAVISPLTLMCLNHLDREMAEALLHWPRFNLRTHVTTDQSLPRVNSSWTKAFSGKHV